MKHLGFVIAFGAIVFAGCKKDHSVTEIAGSGGPASLRVSMVHNGTQISQGRVRMKYNATAAPASSNWDDSANLTTLPSTAAQALFPKLYKGRYYLEGTGYLPNSTFQEPRIVKGGFAYTLTDTGTVNLVLQLDMVVQ